MFLSKRSPLFCLPGSRWVPASSYVVAVPIFLFFLLMAGGHVYGQNVMYRKVSEAEAQVPYSDESEAVIYSIEGRQVMQSRFKEKTEMKIRSLGAGNYILKVKNGARTYVTRLNVL